MSYSGAQIAKTSRENLGKALAALQADPNIPQDVMGIVQNVAQAMAALFEAERAPGEPEGKSAVKRALGVVGQTLALLQDVRAAHPGIQVATASIAQTMSSLYPLTTQPSMRPPAPSHSVQPPQGMGGAPMMGQPAPPSFPQQPQQQYAPGVMPASVAFATTSPQQAAPAQPQQFSAPQQPAYPPPPQQPAYPPPPQQPQFAPPQPAQPQAYPAQAPQQPAAFQAPAQPYAPNPYAQPLPAAPAPAAPSKPAQQQQQGAYRGGTAERVNVEVNIGATTDSNFYVGFSGEISEGGVFCATYNIQPRNTPMRVLVTLPGNFEKHVNGFVRFVRDPMDLTAESEPGMGIQFEGLDPEARDLILRFIRKRPPMFYDE
jgi:uncharacterized protein (TIGR02266 family)